MSEQRLSAVEACAASVKIDVRSTIERVVRLEVHMDNTHDIVRDLKNDAVVHHTALMNKIEQGNKRLTAHMDKEESTRAKLTWWVIGALLTAVVTLAGVNYDTLRVEHSVAMAQGTE